ncbi:MAG: helix-turn-helix domain-containing protein [Solirubrobacterales bacterium]
MRKKSPDAEQALLACLRHPLRKRLLRLYVEEGGRLSPKELADFTKRHLSSVSYHVRKLAECGAVELVDTRPRRGAVEHFYKATALVDEVPWGRTALGLQPEQRGKETEPRDPTNDEEATPPS